MDKCPARIFFYLYGIKQITMKNILYWTLLTAALMIAVVPFLSNAQNYVTTYAGTGSPGFMNGDTSVASFNSPFGICLDAEGNVYLADAQNHRIRKISTDGQVTTFAGTGTAGYLDGPADEAKFNQPLNICFDPEGNMYVSDFINQRIRKISSDMEVTTVAGTGVAGWQNGPAAEAKFNYPRGICVDDTGNIYIGDSWNHRIRRISVEGMVTDWAGGGTVIGVQSVGDYVDAGDTAARFYTPCELSIDQYNNIFVADAYNHRIRKIDPDRMVTTVAGSGGFGPDGGGFNNGPAGEAQFNVPTACHVIPDGTIFVGDGSNQRVREISIYGTVSTFAGSGETGFEDGADTLATFNFPRGTVLDVSKNILYVVDYNNHAIRIIHLVPVVGLKETDAGKNVRVFPNPSNGQVAISFQPQAAETFISVYSENGQVVRKLRVSNQNTVEIDLSSLDPGVYYVKLVQENEVIAVKKLVIGT